MLQKPIFWLSKLLDKELPSIFWGRRASIASRDCEPLEPEVDAVLEAAELSLCVSAEAEQLLAMPFNQEEFHGRRTTT